MVEYVSSMCKYIGSVSNKEQKESKAKRRKENIEIIGNRKRQETSSLKSELKRKKSSLGERKSTEE